MVPLRCFATRASFVDVYLISASKSKRSVSGEKEKEKKGSKPDSGGAKKHQDIGVPDLATEAEQTFVESDAKVSQFCLFQ